MNLNFSYSPTLAKLAGLVLQLRFAQAWEEQTCAGGDADDVSEIRFVGNYSFDF